MATLDFEVKNIKFVCVSVEEIYISYFRIFGDELTLMWLDENKEHQQLVVVKEPKVRGLRWFSVGSNDTLAHWRVNCKAKGEKLIVTLNIPAYIISNKLSAPICIFHLDPR